MNIFIHFFFLFWPKLNSLLKQFVSANSSETSQQISIKVCSYDGHTFLIIFFAGSCALFWTTETVCHRNFYISFLIQLPESLSLWRTYSVYMHVCKEILIQFMGRIISLWALFKFIQNINTCTTETVYQHNSPKNVQTVFYNSCKFIIKIYILCIFIGNSYLILFLREYIY